MAIDFSAVRAFTFDCYGTLVDWEQGILRAVRPVLAVNGVRAADDEIIRAYAEAEAAEESGEYQPYRDVLGGVMERLADRFGWALDPKERPRIADSLARWPVYPDAARACMYSGSPRRWWSAPTSMTTCSRPRVRGWNPAGRSSATS